MLPNEGQVGVIEGVEPDQLIFGIGQCQQDLALCDGQDLTAWHERRIPLETDCLHLWRPVVGFLLAVLAPGIERVVHHHTVLEHFMIVDKGLRQAERNRI